LGKEDQQGEEGEEGEKGEKGEGTRCEPLIMPIILHARTLPNIIIPHNTRTSIRYCNTHVPSMYTHVAEGDAVRFLPTAG